MNARKATIIAASAAVLGAFCAEAVLWGVLKDPRTRQESLANYFAFFFHLPGDYVVAMILGTDRGSMHDAFLIFIGGRGRATTLPEIQ